MIYLDNNATTCIAPEVLEAMLPFLSHDHANPSSAYSFGRRSRQAVEKAREELAALINAEEPSEVVFTSGGTESDNWAILGALQLDERRKEVVTTAVEHEAVRKLCDKLEATGVRVTRLGVAPDGSIDMAELRSALTPETAIVSVMHANNETGVLFPIEEIAAVVKEHSEALFHSDGVNAAGKVPIDVRNSNIDLYSMSGHKFHAPKGIGALYIRKGTTLPPMLIGGGQESGRRAGTEAVHQIVGLGAAAKLATDFGLMADVRSLRDRAESKILEEIPKSRLNGTSDPSFRLPNTSNLSFENTNGEGILARLDELGICISTGSACASTDHSVSPVLAAMNVPYSFAMGSIRFSLSRYTTTAEIDMFVEALAGVVGSLREMTG